MTNEYTPSFTHLVQLARARRDFLASLLTIYQDQKKLDDQQLADFLSCDVEALPHLALCLRPRPFPDFRQDVERIAQHVHANPFQLAKLIRSAESAEDMLQEQGEVFLLAARDHEEIPDGGGDQEGETHE